jgi:hypothetical protein
MTARKMQILQAKLYRSNGSRARLAGHGRDGGCLPDMNQLTDLLDGAGATYVAGRSAFMSSSTHRSVPV